MYNFKIAKDMAMRFGVAYINYDGQGYYATSCFTHNTMRASGKFEHVQGRTVKAKIF